ncbi:MAG: hypothetical protein R6X02_18940, partial [Enhygromyxa sp.]
MDESDRVGDQLSRNPPARTFLGSAGTRREGEPAVDKSDHVGDQLLHNPPARTFLGSRREPLSSRVAVECGDGLDSSRVAPALTQV